MKTIIPLIAILALGACDGSHDGTVSSPPPAEVPTSPSIPARKTALTSPAPSSVAGMHWNSSPTSILKPYSPMMDEGMRLYVPSGRGEPFIGNEVDESDFMFQHGRLVSGDLYFDGLAKGDAVNQALVKLYGDPTFANDAERYYRWNWRKAHVVVESHFSKNRTTVEISKRSPGNKFYIED